MILSRFLKSTRATLSSVHPCADSPTRIERGLSTGSGTGIGFRLSGTQAECASKYAPRTFTSPNRKD